MGRKRTLFDVFASDQMVAQKIAGKKQGRTKPDVQIKKISVSKQKTGPRTNYE